MNRLYQRRDTLLEEWQEWKTVFITCLFVNLCAYGSYIVLVTYAVDDYDYIFVASKVIVSGRWVIDFLHNFVFRTSLMPTLMPILCIILNILTGIYMCKLWSVQKTTRFLVIALWTAHPYLLDMYNFRLIAFPYSFGYFLTIIALYIAGRGKFTDVFSIILLYLALSTYQPVLGFAISVVMVQVLLMGFRGDFSAASIRECGKLFFRYLLLFAVSAAVYIVITKLIFMVSDVEVNARLQAGFISNTEQFKAKLCVVATILLVRLGPVKEFVLPAVGKVAVFAIYIAAVLAVLRKTPKKSVIWLVLLWIVLIPVGAISFALPLEALSLPWRVCMGLVVFFVGMVALTQESDSLLIRRTGLALSCFLVLYFILNNNTILYRQHLTNQADLITGQRMIAKIQSLDGYRPGMDLAIVGTVKKEGFTKEGKSNLEIVREYASYCSIRRYSLAKSAFETDWSKYAFMLNYMNLELNRAGGDNLKKARELSKHRPPWPDPSSVFIQDDMVVLILSHPDE